MKILFLVLLLSRLALCSGDTYPFTDYLSFRNEVQPRMGMSMQVSPTSTNAPLELQVYLGWTNVFAAVEGMYSSLNDQPFPGSGDDSTKPVSGWYGAYIGYIPGEFRVSILDDYQFQIVPYMAVGDGWKEVQVLYLNQVDHSTLAYNATSKDLWSTQVRAKLGLMLDYKHVGLSVSAGTGFRYEVGLHMVLN